MSPCSVGQVPHPTIGAGRIVAVRQGNLLATSFHPELTGDLRVHRYFVDMVRDAPAAGGRRRTHDASTVTTEA